MTKGASKSRKGAPRKGRPRKGGPGTDVRDLPADFVGLVDERGNVIVDDTAYFRHQRAKDEARARLEQATVQQRARLLELIAQSETERRSLLKRVDYRHELERALHDYESAIVDRFGVLGSEEE